MKIILSLIFSKFYQLFLPMSSSQKYYLLFLFYSHIITNLSFIILETSNNSKLYLWVSYNSQNYACKYQMHQCYTEYINATDCINSTVQCIMLQCINATECMHQYNNATECINVTVHDCYSATISENVTVQLLHCDLIASTFLLWTFSLMKSVEML